MTIPRTIHQVWIGPHPEPIEWTRTWRAAHPGWEYRLWREQDLDRLGLTHQRLYDGYTADRRWCGAVNIARVEILLRHGGVYIDADIECLHPLDDAPFLRGGMFVSRTPNAEGRITNAVMGCAPGHPAIAAYHDALWQVTGLHPSWQCTGAGVLTPIVTGRADVTVLHSGAFLPTRMNGRPGPAYAGTAYGAHHWGTTRGRY